MYKIGQMPKSLELGYIGENLFRTIEINMSAWVEKLPGGVPSIIHIQPGKTEADAYIADTEFDEETNVLSWTVTDADLGTLDSENNGEGDIQIWMEEETVDDSVTRRGKSIHIASIIHRSATAPDPETPAAQTGWMEAMNALKTATVTAAGDAEDAKDDAVTAKEAAEDAQEAAENAQTAAEAAQAQAEAQAQHYPVIVDGYWAFWDQETEQYVKSNQKAQGPQGDPGDPEELIDDTSTGLDKAWSANKSNTLLSAIQPLTPAATASDVGKFLKAKTVVNGKVTEYEFGAGGGGSSDIDDEAGAGDTDKVWSADKIVKEIQQIIVSGGVPIDDTAGQGDINKLWSADKVATLLEYERTVVTSRNLNVTPYAESRTDRQVTFSVNPDNSVDVTGTATGGYAYLLPGPNDLSDYKWLLPAGTYFLSGGISSSRPAIAYLYTNKSDMSAVKSYQDNGSGKKFTTDTDLWCCVGFLISDTNATNMTIKLQLESGTSATTYVSPWPSISESSIFDDIDAEMDAMQDDIDSLKKPEPGTTQYTGERIMLEPDVVQTHKCDLKLWKEFVSADLPSGATAENIYHRNQAMTAYGGYMFLFSQDGGGAVIDIDTKTIISTFNYSTPSNNHQNSAQFSSHFYAAGDEFPLIYVSRCGNSNWSSGEHDNDELLVYRITRVDTTFTFTYINSIRLNATSYGMSWGVDNVTHLLYAQAPIVSNFQYPTGNKIGFWVLREPSLTSILTGTQIVLSPDDALAHFVKDYSTIQGCCVHYGKLYQGVTVPGAGYNNVIVYDTFKGIALTNVPIIAGWEIQGVAVYNGKLYSTNKSDVALRVYEVEF